MGQNCTSTRRGLMKTLAMAATLSLVTTVSCNPVSIDTGDSSPPTVTIKVNGPNGYEEQTSVTHSNSTAQDPIEIMGIVEDPQGVKSIDLRVSDDTVDTAYCGGAIYSGSYVVDGLPVHVGDSLTGSSGQVPTQLFFILTIPGIVQLKSNPSGATGTCFPANNTSITIRCEGGNWSSNAASAKASKTLQVNFKF